MKPILNSSYSLPLVDTETPPSEHNTFGTDPEFMIVLDLLKDFPIKEVKPDTFKLENGF